MTVQFAIPGIAAATAISFSIVAAQPANADPGGNWDACVDNPTTQGCTTWNPVPNMKRAEPGESCADIRRFIFATSSTGQILACQGQSPRYVVTQQPVLGEQNGGAPCGEPALAQAPDGSPLQCSPTGDGQAVWTVSIDDRPNADRSAGVSPDHRLM